jgi:DNA-binding MarR family transcriptional regulator
VSPEPGRAVLAHAIEALQAQEVEGAQPAVESGEFQRYFYGIAEAHQIIRKVFRLVDEQAKVAGLDPLEHKLLIQVFGAPEAPLRVSEVARRLDIPAALTSRLINRLAARDLVARSPDEEDRRTIRVAATEAGRHLLAAIDRDVRTHVSRFQDQVTDSERAAALEIFAFYLGARSRGRDGRTV